MASIGAVFLPVHSVVTILCYKVLNMMIQDPLPEVSLFLQLTASLTNKILVHDSRPAPPCGGMEMVKIQVWEVCMQGMVCV